MHKRVRQEYDIWLGEIKCTVKCEMSLASTFDVANRHLLRMEMGGYQGQNSVFQGRVVQSWVKITQGQCEI